RSTPSSRRRRPVTCSPSWSAPRPTLPDPTSGPLSSRRSIMRVSRLWTGAAVLALGCASAPVEAPRPTMDPGRVPPPRVEVAPPPPPAQPVLPPEEAARRGLMPLASTNAWAYRQSHPNYDGRGVLIG